MVENKFCTCDSAGTESGTGMYVVRSQRALRFILEHLSVVIHRRFGYGSFPRVRRKNLKVKFSRNSQSTNCLLLPDSLFRLSANLHFRHTKAQSTAYRMTETNLKRVTAAAAITAAIVGSQCTTYSNAFSQQAASQCGIRHRCRGTLQHLSSLTDDTPKLQEASSASASASLIEVEASKQPQLESLMSNIQKKIGSVDENRLVFPELASGEVTRMFSSLQYTKLDDGKISSATHVAGSTLGAAALIAGATIGGGVLALPSATAAAGFLPSSAALCVAWCYMTMSGLLIAELSMNRMGETGRAGGSLLDLYTESTGKKAGMVAAASYFFLHYAILLAYIAQGGVNLDELLNSAGIDLLDDIPGTGQILFSGVVGGAMYVSKPSDIGKVRNLLIAGVTASFLGIIAVAAKSCDFPALLDPSIQHPEQVANAFPMLFLTLFYQNMVPKVVAQLEGDRTKITNAIIAGTTVPFLICFAWNAVILGNVMNVPTLDYASLHNFIPLMQNGEYRGGPVINAMVGGFSELVIITGLIGAVYGLLDGFKSVAGLPSSGSAYEKWKPALFAGALLPPLFFSLDNPDIFYNALDYGGAFGVSTLLLVLPALIVWKDRYGEDQKPIMTKPMVPFGKISLASIWKAAGTLIVEQGAEKLGVIESLQGTAADLLL